MALFSRREFVEFLAQMREDIAQADCPVGMTLGAAGFVLLALMCWPLVQAVELLALLAQWLTRPKPQPTPRPVSQIGSV